MSKNRITVGVALNTGDEILTWTQDLTPDELAKIKRHLANRLGDAESSQVRAGLVHLILDGNLHNMGFAECGHKVVSTDTVTSNKNFTTCYLCKQAAGIDA